MLRGSCCAITALRALLLIRSSWLDACVRSAPDENAWHLNGVVLLRRSDFFAIGGYDERFRGYGWDDTDLYTRLSEAPLGLRRRCVNYTAVRHDGVGHAPRGETWATEFLHRRAVSTVWQRWHATPGLLPSSWALLRDVQRVAAARAASTAAPPNVSAATATATADATAAAASTASAAASACEVRCVRRPPYFEELATAPEDAAPGTGAPQGGLHGTPSLMAVEWKQVGGCFRWLF